VLSVPFFEWRDLARGGGGGAASGAAAGPLAAAGEWDGGGGGDGDGDGGSGGEWAVGRGAAAASPGQPEAAAPPDLLARQAAYLEAALERAASPSPYGLGHAGGEFDRGEFDRGEFDRGEFDRGEFDRGELAEPPDPRRPAQRPRDWQGSPL
jgi:hypothetical protein